METIAQAVLFMAFPISMLVAAYWSVKKINKD
jgi:hypothetical protein